MKTLVFLKNLVQFAFFSMALLCTLGIPSFIEEENFYSAILCAVFAAISWFGIATFVKK